MAFTEGYQRAASQGQKVTTGQCQGICGRREWPVEIVASGTGKDLGMTIHVHSL